MRRNDTGNDLQKRKDMEPELNCFTVKCMQNAHVFVYSMWKFDIYETL